MTTRQSGAIATEKFIFISGSYGSASISGDKLLLTSNAQGTQTVYSNCNGSGLAGTEYSVSADFHFQPNTGSLNKRTCASLVLNDFQSNDVLNSLDLMLLLRANGEWEMYTAGTVVGSGTIDPSNSYHVELAIDETGDSDTFDLIIDGNILVDDAAWTPYDMNRYLGMRYYGYAGTYKMAFDNFTVAVVPEPSSLVLLGIGSLTLLLIRRRQKQA